MHESVSDNHSWIGCESALTAFRRSLCLQTYLMPGCQIPRIWNEPLMSYPDEQGLIKKLSEQSSDLMDIQPWAVLILDPGSLLLQAKIRAVGWRAEQCPVQASYGWRSEEITNN